MEQLLLALGEYGFGAIVMAVFCYYLYKQNERFQEKIDAQNTWHLNFTESNTKATIEQTSAFKVVGETLAKLVQEVSDLRDGK